MPSRKIISVLIITCALVGAVILASPNRGFQRQPENTKNFVEIVSQETRNPILANSDWQKDLEILPNQENVVENASSTETLTDQVSRSLMANYLALKQSGDLDDASAQNLINQTVNFIENSQADKYTTADIIVSPDNSQEAVRRYGAELGSAFMTYKLEHPNRIIYLFSLSVRSKDSWITEEMKTNASDYKEIARFLSKIQIPSSYSGVHLQLVNALHDMSLAAEEMSNLISDPVKSINGINLYQESYTEIITTIKQIRLQILNKDRVIYKQGESGYYFYYGI